MSEQKQKTPYEIYCEGPDDLREMDALQLLQTARGLITKDSLVRWMSEVPLQNFLRDLIIIHHTTIESGFTNTAVLFRDEDREMFDKVAAVNAEVEQYLKQKAMREEAARATAMKDPRAMLEAIFGKRAVAAAEQTKPAEEGEAD